MKLLDLWNAQEAISNVCKERLSPKMSYRAMKLRDTILKEIEPIEKTRQELVKKYGQTKEDGSCEITSEQTINLNAYFSDFNEVLDETVQIEYKPLNLGTLDVSPNDLKNLMPFLEDEYLKELE